MREKSMGRTLAEFRTLICGIILSLVILGCGAAQSNSTGPTAVQDQKISTRIREAKTAVTNEPSTPANAKERIIVYETKADLDNDGKPERVVLDVEKEGYRKIFGTDLYRYSRLLIYKTDGDKEELVFDSIKAGIADFEGGMVSKEELIKIADDDKNGIPEIYLKELPTPTIASRFAIVEKQNNGYQILFLDHLNDFKYKDWDNDGTIDLYGLTEEGGQIRFNPALLTVYKRIGNKYVPSYDGTKALLYDSLQKSKAAFKNKPESWLANSIIGTCALLRDKAQLKSFITENKEYLIKINIFYDNTKLDDVDVFVRNFQPLDRRKAGWLENLKKYSLYPSYLGIWVSGPDTQTEEAVRQKGGGILEISTIDGLYIEGKITITPSPPNSDVTEFAIYGRLYEHTADDTLRYDYNSQFTGGRITIKGNSLEVVPDKYNPERNPPGWRGGTFVRPTPKAS